MGRLEGKTALVTGAASGIGLQTSIRLAEEGARVMMTDINLEEGLQQAEKLGANAAFLKLDITEEEEWISVLDETVKRFDRLDILVNSAGMVLIADVEQITLEDWRKVHAVNLDGTFLGCKHGVRVMKEFGAGSIINLSSVSGIIGGFNRHLGWSTTNNSPRYSQVYAVPRHPTRQGHVLIDGGAVQLRDSTITVDWTEPDGTTGSESEVTPWSPWGPVVHLDDDFAYVLTDPRDG